jgi:hypothetical protein
VIAEISTLRHLVKEHSNFYNGFHRQVSIHRKIGMTIIEDIIQDDMDVQIVAQDLRDDLRDVVAVPDSPHWIEHLHQICRTARRVSQKMSNHEDAWSFGPWDDETVLFPKVTANGREMMKLQYH